MGELKKTNQATNTNSNANNVSGNGTAALAAPKYSVDAYQDDKDIHDPMDLLGNHIQNEIIVPANASPEEKFHYYRAILNSIGQDVEVKPGSVHILALRGVIRDGEGNIIQTASAARYQASLHGLGELTDQQHFSDSNTARKSQERINDTKEGQGTWNDMIIFLKVDKDKNCTAEEKIGSVDPAKTGDRWGTAHLMDGTFEFKLGTHGTDIEKHVDQLKIMREGAEKGSLFSTYKAKGKLRYQALVPKDKLKILRDGVVKKQKKYINRKDSNGYFTDKDIKKFKRRSKTHPYKYFDKSAATNGHVGGVDESFSEGCWNLPVEQFKEMMILMKEQQALQEKSDKDFIVNFTLLDASKVGFKLVKQENQSPRLEEREDFGAALDLLEEIIELINDWK